MPILILVVAVIFLDQSVKYWVGSKMLLGMSVPVIPNIFHFTYVNNPGAAFGLLEHRTLVFVLIAIALFAVVIYFYPRLPREYPLLRCGIGLLTGGAAGNLIDRIRTGYVMDYLDFRIWPVFNIADIAIVTGVCIIIYMLLFKMDKKDEVL
ncbi:MAG: Lipoprotein signal peptidase [Firmicutes bacterium]|nr:Lipoprotein signal peptidase [Bacillota bacterium]